MGQKWLSDHDGPTRPRWAVYPPNYTIGRTMVAIDGPCARVEQHVHSAQEIAAKVGRRHNQSDRSAIRAKEQGAGPRSTAPETGRRATVLLAPSPALRRPRTSRRTFPTTIVQRIRRARSIAIWHGQEQGATNGAGSGGPLSPQFPRHTHSWPVHCNGPTSLSRIRVWPEVSESPKGLKPLQWPQWA